MNAHGVNSGTKRTGIATYLEINGTIDKEMLFKPLFTDMHQGGIIEIFDDADSRKVIMIIDGVNGNAGVV